MMGDFPQSVITPLVGVIQPCADLRPDVRRKSSELDCPHRVGNDGNREIGPLSCSEGRTIVPSHVKQPGQAWPLRPDGTHRPRCYKCEHWRSNMPLTGRCAIAAKRNLLSSHDMMPGDGCARFSLKDFTEPGGKNV